MRKRLAALALLALCLIPRAGLARETVEADFEGGRWLYEDTERGVCIEIVRREDEENRVLWYEADLRFGEASPLRFLTANEESPGKGFWYPERLAREKRAVFAINDDQFGHRVYNHDTVGVIVRGGEVLSERTRKSGSKGWPPLDTAAFFPDGSMRVFESAEHTGEEYLAMGAENVLAFGPWLVRGGEINPALETSYRTKEPRTAIGMIEPYHYVALYVEGRVERSGGVACEWLAQRMAELGAAEAINLDGGKTSCLVFMGVKLSISNPDGLVRDGRSVSGMIGLGESDLAPAWEGLDK
ncbi:MAG TPA: phosphodiester glycosidase family protein [Candidatus Limiplasma pullicola]|nr:phosphodiester glycosidase family protein [Candidatus Limiplasma pullicola]